jgi:hypothetical protein
MTETLAQVFIDVLIQSLYALYVILIVAIPFMLGYVFFVTWVKYSRAKFFSEQDHILLEFRLPKEITKSPIAMEVFLGALSQTGGEGTWFDKYWKGGMRAWFSLEMVSLEGQVKFFIWTRKGLKKTIETQLYSQYPDVEITEVDDYTEGVTYDPSKNEVWGCQFVKTKDSFYPIRTYVDYGLDKDPKEELKIDPITPVIELLGSIGEGEQMWIQILIRAHKAEFQKPGTWFEKVDWKHFAKEELKKKLKRDKGDGEVQDKLTKSEKSAVDAIEKSISKTPFDAGIRALYIADKDKFNKANTGGLSGSFKQYGSIDLNSFKPDGTTSFDYPWQDIFGTKLKEKKAKILKGYQSRGFFPPLFKSKIKPFILNSEELATIYHFPGKVSRTPTFTRITSRKAEAPSNLPI